jgi:hypothetical protein
MEHNSAACHRAASARAWRMRAEATTCWLKEHRDAGARAIAGNRAQKSSAGAGERSSLSRYWRAQR